MELHKSVSALNKSVPCQELVREFIDQMVAYSNLDEEVIRKNLLKRTPSVFHQVINEAFAKASENKEGGSVADGCGSVAEEGGSTEA
jgi:hypothetical protein